MNLWVGAGTAVWGPACELLRRLAPVFPFVLSSGAV